MDIRTKGLNHLCFPTYYRGPFVASNIANMYCTECIIGIIQNAPVNSHHGYTDKGIEPPVLSYILQRPIRSIQYCEYVLYRMLSYRTPSRLRFARTRRDEGGIEPPVLSYILQRPIRSVQYCEYVLYRMYYRYHTERRNSL